MLFYSMGLYMSYVFKVLCITFNEYTCIFVLFQSFVKMLEKVASLLLNSTVGIYISVMTWKVTSKQYR